MGDFTLSEGDVLQILVGPALIPIELLINGVTVLQSPCESVTYWHVELESHDVLLSDGLASESYLDTGNRCGFVEAGAFLELHPNFQPKHWTETCMALVKEGEALLRVRTLLHERAAALGYRLTAADQMHLRADGERIEPMHLQAGRVMFVLPADCRDITLHSRTFIPAHANPHSADQRALGICVQRLQIDGNEVALDQIEGGEEGWHQLETTAGAVQRWTRAKLNLPATTRTVLIDLAGQGHYWEVPPGKAARLAA